jgi:hypothetical protein
MSDGTTASESAAQNSNRDENAVQMTFDWLPRQPVSVVDDLGPVGEGVSRSRHIAATDGNEYLIKGPELLPENPYGACNELLAWQIATSLRLPILDCTLVEWKQKIYFGSQWIERGAFQFMTENLLDQCGNRDIVYDLVAFDAYLINDDRHVHNLRARRERIQGGHDRLIAYLE